MVAGIEAVEAVLAEARTVGLPFPEQDTTSDNATRPVMRLERPCAPTQQPRQVASGSATESPTDAALRRRRGRRDSQVPALGHETRWPEANRT